MQSYEINWAFLLDYDKESGNLDVKFSNKFIEDYQLENTTISLSNHEIYTFLHRYDFRKLDYFCQSDIQETFDTLMRFTINKNKYPLRTIAICKLNNHGMSCINFEESKLFKLRKLKRVNYANKVTQPIGITNACDLLDDHQIIISKIEAHLSKIVERNREMV